MGTQGTNELLVKEPPSLKDALTAYGAEMDALVREAGAIRKINTPGEEARGGELVVAFGEKLRAGDRVRKALVEPFQGMVKRINAAFAAETDKGEAAWKTLKAKVAQRAMENQAKADAEAEAECKRLAKNFKAQTARAEDAGREAPPPPPQVEAVRQSNVGGATIRMVWSYTVTNKNAIPAAYLDVRDGDLKRELARLAQAGLPTVIPGIEAKQVPSVAS